MAGLNKSRMLVGRVRVLLGAVPLRLEQSKPAGTGGVTGVAISGILLPMPLKPPESTKEKQVPSRSPRDLTW